MMAKRSNRRWERLRIPEALEAAKPLSPHRADAHHGQEQLHRSTHRSDIRSQSHPFAYSSAHSCKSGGVHIRNPVFLSTSWTPAFAGMTETKTREHAILFQQKISRLPARMCANIFSALRRVLAPILSSSQEIAASPAHRADSEP